MRIEFALKRMSDALRQYILSHQQLNPQRARTNHTSDWQLMRNGRYKRVLRPSDTTTVIADVGRRQVWNHRPHTHTHTHVCSSKLSHYDVCHKHEHWKRPEKITVLYCERRQLQQLPVGETDHQRVIGYCSGCALRCRKAVLPSNL